MTRKNLRYFSSTKVSINLITAILFMIFFLLYLLSYQSNSEIRTKQPLLTYKPSKMTKKNERFF